MEGMKFSFSIDRKDHIYHLQVYLITPEPPKQMNRYIICEDTGPTNTLDG